MPKKKDIMRKSVAVPDSNLPTGWTKHAILKPDNIWEIFLLSPDGYQISTEEELKHYFEIMPNGSKAPDTLDFEADFSLLPDLEAQQKDLPVVGTPKLWISKEKRKARRGGRRGGRTHTSSGPGRSIGRVRTLLPKSRVDPTPLPAANSPPAPITLPPTTSASDREIWRCPKEACDKKFRKESLLQMHIKHYHSELSSLVRSVPNMVDLATARSESVNCDWTPPPSEVPKISQPSIKRMLPRPFTSPNHNIEESEVDSTLSESPVTPVPGPSRLMDRGLGETSTPLKRQNAVEERRTTIKTMLPLRPADPVVKIEPPDEPESEDDYIEQKKNGSRIFKPGKYKRGGRLMTGSMGDSSLDEYSYEHSSFSKVAKRRKYSEKTYSSSEYYSSLELHADEEKQPLQLDDDDGVVLERLKLEEFINCICGFREEDGLMIQCDICMCWQHGLCCGLDEKNPDVPERYVCAICRNPFRARSSQKYCYAKQNLTQGKLPTFSYRTRDEDKIKQREDMLKRCYELSASIYEMKNVDRSLLAKLNIARKADHPKLYMWAKNWEDQESRLNSQKEQQMMELGEPSSSSSDIVKVFQSGPEPEAPIDLDECRSRLLDHVEQTYCQMEDRITSLETQIMALESQGPPLSTPPSDKVTKQTLQMLIRDLTTLQKLAAIS